MSELEASPSTTEFRDNLEDYLKAVARGERFHLVRGIMNLGTCGPVEKMPKEFRPTAKHISFSNFRKEVKSVSSALMRGRAFIVTKRAKSVGSPTGRKTKAKTADQYVEVAAIWPLSGPTRHGELLQEISKIAARVGELHTEFRELRERLQPLSDDLQTLRVLHTAERELRSRLDNLRLTATRHGVEIS